MELFKVALGMVLKWKALLVNDNEIIVLCAFQMVSAERVMAYGQLETESSLETDPSVMLRPDWPTKGHIELDNLIYRHSISGPPVLKGITCEIKPSGKVGA